MRRAAVALKVHGKTLPKHRRKELQQMVRGFVTPEGPQAGDDTWLSQEEMEQGLLAGLAPRQKRRMLRQLAAEKDQAGEAADSSQTQTDDAEQIQAQAIGSSNAIQDPTASGQHDSSANGANRAQYDRQEGAVPDDDDDELAADGPGASDQHGTNASGRQLPSAHEAESSSNGTSDKPNLRSSSKGVSDEDTNGHAWHGRQVVNAALAEGGSDALLVLIQRFRQSFTEALHPKFLPSAWHVMHRYVHVCIQIGTCAMHIARCHEFMVICYASFPFYMCDMMSSQQC